MILFQIFPVSVPPKLASLFPNIVAIRCSLDGPDEFDDVAALSLQHDSEPTNRPYHSSS